MPRLKSRTKHPPGGFQLLLPEIGMTKPISGSFEMVLNEFSKIVARNPAQAQKFGWPVDRVSQADFLDEREAKRCLAHGWGVFVEQGTPTVYQHPDATVKKNWRGAAAVVVNSGRAAFSAYASLFGPGGKPVSRELAEARAAVCDGCPKNDTTAGLSSFFLESTARGIMALLGALKDLNVSTSHDDKLGVCRACMCPTRAKVWVNKDVIVQNMPESVWPELERERRRCWILSESNRQ